MLGGALLLVAVPPAGSPVLRQEIRGAVGSPASQIADELPMVRAPDPDASDPGLDARLAPPPESLTGYVWPIRKARLTLPFGPTDWGSRVVDGALFHDGIDLATFCGDRITAAHAGVVLAAGRHFDDYLGWLGDLGPYKQRLDQKGLWVTLPIVVVTDDGNGYRSIYAHFSRVVVKVGETIRAGQLLGYEGATGRASGCHLHYGLFSPDAVATFALDPTAAAHMLLPTEEIARIDPLLVLPPLAVAGIH